MYKYITPQDAYTMMNTQDVRVVDVRETFEYQMGHIPHSINIPLSTLNMISSVIKDKDETLLIYCRSGNRSKTASLKLIESGYTDVYDFGGILDWTYGITKD